MTTLVFTVPAADRVTLRLMTVAPSMSLPEWTVLAILSQQPAHGFAIAQLTAPRGELGRIWHIPKGVVYRAIGRLQEAGLITPDGTEPGLGPQRTVYTAVPAGRRAAREWLETPARHVRDIRSQLLLKLALLDRAGADPVGLLRRQRAALEPIARAIEAGHAPPDGFDATHPLGRGWRPGTPATSAPLAPPDGYDQIMPDAAADPLHLIRSFASTVSADPDADLLHTREGAASWLHSARILPAETGLSNSEHAALLRLRASIIDVLAAHAEGREDGAAAARLTRALADGRLVLTAGPAGTVRLASAARASYPSVVATFAIAIAEAAAAGTWPGV